MNKTVKYIIWFVVIAVCCIVSVRIQTIEEYKNSQRDGSLDAAAEVGKFWQTDFKDMKQSAIPLADLEANPELAKEKGNTVGIGAPYSVSVKIDKANVSDVNAETAALDIQGCKQKYVLRHAMIFCGSIREASKAFKVDDYTKLLDFNKISTELNMRIENKLKGKLKAGNTYTVYAVMDIPQDKPLPETIELIPFCVE